MKKILLLSDTHGYIDKHIMEYVNEADEVWHAGDIGSVEVTDTISNIKTLRAVYGNIDGMELKVIFPKDLVFTCEGVKVLMTHIGGRPARYDRPGVRLHPRRPCLCGDLRRRAARGHHGCRRGLGHFHGPHLAAHHAALRL